MRSVIVAALLLVTGAGLLARPVEVRAAGSFVGSPTFGTSGQAAAVFLGGSVSDLEGAAGALSANGVWAQDKSGAFQLLVVGGPAFLRDGFTAKFPGGFTGAVAVTLTKPTGASSTSTAPAQGTPVAGSTSATPRPGLPPLHGGVPGPATND